MKKRRARRKGATARPKKAKPPTPKKGRSRPKAKPPTPKKVRPRPKAKSPTLKKVRAPSKKASLRREIRDWGISKVAKKRQRHPATLRRWLREGFPDRARSVLAKIVSESRPQVELAKKKIIARVIRAFRKDEIKASNRKEPARRAKRLKAMAPSFRGMTRNDILDWAEENDYDPEEVWDAYDEQ